MNKKKKYFICANGCIRRKIEAEKIAIWLQKNGLINSDNIQEADIILISTCGYDGRNQDDSIAIINNITQHFHFEQNNREIIVLGCFPHMNNEYHKNNSSKYYYISPNNISEVQNILEKQSIPFSEISEPYKISNIKSYSDVLKIKSNDKFHNASTRIQSNINYQNFKESSGIIKIASGCLSNCSYCAIKPVMGNLRSKPISKIIEEILSCNDEKLTFTAEDTGAYGIDKGCTLLDLFIQVNTLKLKKEIALTGLNPTFLNIYSSGLIDLLNNTSMNFKHIVIPIQSFSDNILRKMNRKYSSSGVINFFHKVNEKNANIQLHGHILVGFPGETMTDVNINIEQIKELNYVNFKIFKYFSNKNEK